MVLVGVECLVYGAGWGRMPGMFFLYGAVTKQVIASSSFYMEAIGLVED